MEALPKGAAKPTERRLSRACFPNVLPTLMGHTYKSFLDRSQAFNQLEFLTDLKRRLVAVLFVEKNPKAEL